jgi:hypothetical protein
MSIYQNKLLVVTVCTEDCPGLRNWKRSLIQHDYEFIVLEYGEMWQGWLWRTKRYLHFLQTLDDNLIVVLTDATDVLFVRDKHILLNKFLKIEKDHPNKAIMGAEPACCTGRFVGMKEEVNLICGQKTVGRYRFPNAGLIMGRVLVLKDLLDKNNDENDQAGYLKRWLVESQPFYLDHTQEVFGNLSEVIPLNRLSTDKVENEMDVWSLSEGKIKNILYGTKPSVLHFAGRNLQDYNTIGVYTIKDFEFVYRFSIKWWILVIILSTILILYFVKNY